MRYSRTSPSYVENILIVVDSFLLIGEPLPTFWETLAVKTGIDLVLIQLISCKMSHRLFHFRTTYFFTFTFYQSFFFFFCLRSNFLKMYCCSKLANIVVHFPNFNTHYGFCFLYQIKSWILFLFTFCVMCKCVCLVFNCIEVLLHFDF